MKLLAAIGVLLFVSVPAHAQAAKPCEELKDEITKKLDAKGVKGYTLEIVAKDKDAEGKIVGTCDGDTKKILYNRASAPAATPAKEPPCYHSTCLPSSIELPGSPVHLPVSGDPDLVGTVPLNPMESYPLPTPTL
jgi:hypothetical protein